MSVGSFSPLDASVLVLNKMFMAVHVISVRRAFCLLCKDLAEVVSLEDGQFATYDFSTWQELERVPGAATSARPTTTGCGRRRPRSRRRG